MRQRTPLQTAVVCGGAATAAVLFAFSVQPVRAVQVDIGPATIVMQGKYNKPASFPHRRHQQWHGCTACHHAQGQVMTIDKCESCHNADMGNSQLDGLRKAAHVLCKDCHSNERKKGRTAAPSQCRGCHAAAD